MTTLRYHPNAEPEDTDEELPANCVICGAPDEEHAGEEIDGHAFIPRYEFVDEEEIDQ